MEVYRRSSWLLLFLCVTLLSATLQGVQGEGETEGPSESECRPYIEKALKELEAGETENFAPPGDGDSKEDIPTVEITTDDSDYQGDGDNDADGEDRESSESTEIERNADESTEDNEGDEKSEENHSDNLDSKENDAGASEEDSRENVLKSDEDQADQGEQSQEVEEAILLAESVEAIGLAPDEDSKDESKESEDAANSQEGGSKQVGGEDESVEYQPVGEVLEEIAEDVLLAKHAYATVTTDGVEKERKEDDDKDSKEADSTDSKEVDAIESAEANAVDSTKADAKDSKEHDEKDSNESNSKEDDGKASEEAYIADSKEDSGRGISVEDLKAISREGKQDSVENDKSESKEDVSKGDDVEDSKEDSKEDDDVARREHPVEELIQEFEEGIDLRPREHVDQLLKLDEVSSDTEKITGKVSDMTLRELKKLYENAIKPLETLYKYRDLSNRHFGDAEIFSKPLILFMGPWSGGKSSIINYLTDNEYSEFSLRTGAEPSPAYFNILMYGEESEIIDGTELAADYTFSGLQKFGEGLEERLRGYRLPKPLLEKVNIVEIPGILEVRKQVSRVFPFNDACQWFIDRADIIFLVYDPSKLDVGPETEAILDQLKGREHQTRILLNKADQVKPEELMRVQGALIWNISPLMSSAQPPIMYTTSLWSKPYESWAPVRLLQAQERAFLRDLRSAVDKRIENKISSARRFAVRVRNHAKMVDCYLTTYYNHKTVFGNRKQVSDEIIDHPQDYHIYEGLSTLTNISRYDLPDPDVYRDFFRLNALYEFQQLSATCTYFRGCPINRLDVAIAYDFPELVGKHKRMVEAAITEASQAPTPTS